MIQVEGLTKHYGNFKAVDHVSLLAENGKVTILLGANGAGKSTTIKSIAGLLKYEGSITIDGYENTDVMAKRKFGYIPETPSLYDLLTIEEHVRFICKAYRCEEGEEKANELLERLDLSDKKKKMARELSKGMTQKLSMVLALLTNPDSILIDEPMIGLDPAAIETVLELLTELKQQQKSVLISTHIIDIIDNLWDVAYIMDKGKIIRKVVREELQSETLKEIFFHCTQENKA